MGDTVTQLQDQVNHVSMLMFNCIGTLQRDSLPAERIGEQLQDLSDEIPKQIDLVNKQQQQQHLKKGITKEQIAEMTKQLVDASRVINSLADQLPDAEGTPEEQLKRIEELQEEHEKIEETLKRELEIARKKLDEINAEFERLADKELGF
jgi:predicted  nucleic acid-binding Zn-ribbon protein